MKIKAAILCILSAFLLTSCQLALSEKENNTGDRLVGVFVTSEHLDLFDMDGYLNDNLGSLAGGEIKQDDNMAEYEGRLYASLDGTGDNNAKFGDVDGISFFNLEHLNEAGEKTSSLYSDNGMVNGKYGSFYGDDEDKLTLDGTIYMVPGIKGQTQYINPVYQSTDGKIFAKAGGGMSVEGVQSQGGVMSQKLEETLTVTENGKSKKKTVVINIAIETMLPPQKINIIQVDKSHSILINTEYIPGKLPESLKLDKAAEYIIVEVLKKDFDGKAIVERQLCSMADTSVTTYCKGSTNVLAAQYTQLIWQS